MDRPHVIFFPFCCSCIDFHDKWGLRQSVLLREPLHLPFCQLLDPIGHLEVPIATGHDKVGDPRVVIKDVPFWAITGQERDHLSIHIQPFLQFLYLISNGEMVEGVSLLSLSDSGSKSFGNVIDGHGVVLVEVHHVFSGIGGDGSWRSRGGPYGG
jgi:hypothetical protein